MQQVKCRVFSCHAYFLCSHTVTKALHMCPFNSLVVSLYYSQKNGQLHCQMYLQKLEYDVHFPEVQITNKK